MSYSNLSKFLKNIFYFFIFIFIIIYAFFTYPFYHIYKEIFRRICINNLLTFMKKFYGCNIKNSDFIVEDHLPVSIEIIRKFNDSIFARSKKIEKGTCFEIFIENNEDLIGFPIIHNIESSLKRLSKVFKIEQSIHIYFKNYKITSVRLELKLNHHIFQNSDILLNLELTSSLDITNIQKIESKGSMYSFFEDLTIYKDISFEDVSLLLYLKTVTEQSVINDLLPEINTPSAYDFKSDNFQQRLLLVEMMKY